MSLDQKSTIGFGEKSDVDYISTLEEAIGGDWRRVDNAQAFEADLGYGMCDLRIEFDGDGWIGKLASVNPPTRRETDRCADLSAALIKLRCMIRDHGLLLKDRGERLTAVAAGDDSPG
jgi:hypothetical protein